jgi:hypothetical protein
MTDAMATVTKEWIRDNVTTISAFGGEIDKDAVMKMQFPAKRMRTTLTCTLVKAVERGRYHRPFNILIDAGSRGLCWAECRANGKPHKGGILDDVQ